jgi:excinuclease ABC subunit A
MENEVKIKGARQHNLKNINVKIPKNKLVVFTGVSGSGKSSLAYDTIYAEGQRRYVESLSSYARQFLGIMDKPDVDTISGLSPSISISQKTVSHNPRSTVGTITEIYDYLRLLFARIGNPHCSKCGRKIVRQDIDQIIYNMRGLIEKEGQGLPKSKPTRWIILAPVIRGRKGEFTQLFKDLKNKGFTFVRIDGQIYSLDDDLILIKTNRHTIDVVVDKLTIERKSDFTRRLTEAVQQALGLSNGLVILSKVEDASFSFPKKPKNLIDNLYSELFSCPVCNISLAEVEPRLFSFNTPHGACKKCNGLGEILKVDPSLVLNENLTIAEGAITPLSSQFMHDTWLARTIIKVCEENDIPIRKPLSELSKKHKDVLLFGTEKKIYSVVGTNRYGDTTTIYETFPGVISIIESKFRKTQSKYMQEQINKFMRQEICPRCYGARLKPESLAVTVADKNISQVTQLSIKDSFEWIANLSLSERNKIIGTPIIKEISSRLGFLSSVGLDYLTLSRKASTLAGGEAQRIILASQIGSGLTGVLYVLDEPSIGLHQRDNKKLIKTLKNLRDLGNTVIVVEHDQETIESADYIVDFGPGGGKHGGKIVAQGKVNDIKNNRRSLTGDYLSGRKKIEVRSGKWDILDSEVGSGISRSRKSRSQNIVPQSAKGANLTSHITHHTSLILTGCSQFNLKNIDVQFPLGKLICVTGVSGSGKSTLIVETLYKALKLQFNRYYKNIPGRYKNISGWQSIKAVQLIDQAPIGRTSRSNPATYTKAFDYIRDLFASTKLSRLFGFKKGRFSFNVKGGRCEACEGQGENRIQMQFMSDIYVKCEICSGKRYNSQTLEVNYKDKNIADILDLTVEEALKFFKNIPGLYRKLKTLDEVGLSYIELGQPAPLLSGGEAQRTKLAAELSKHGAGDTLYILDEPTTGLHFDDLKKLLKVLGKLVEKGNTVIVIEHNLDVIKNADWIVDLGPEGGDDGGEIVAAGTPYQLAKVENSYTGQFLKKLLL